MKETHILLVGILIVFLALVSYRVTHALFSSGASSTGNIFAAASIFPTTTPSVTPTTTPTTTPTSTPSVTPTPTVQPGDIVINEANVNGGDTSEWVELFNKSSFTIDVSGWKLSDNNSTEVLPSAAPIAPGGYAIVKSADNTVSVPGGVVVIDLDSPIGNGLANGGDSLLLATPGDLSIDGVSWGTDSTILNPAAPTVTGTPSLARIPNSTDTNAGTDWSLDSTPTIGVANVL